MIKMTEHFYFRGHLCIAMELLSINLYELIKANGFVGFSTTLIRRFTTQMLQSLALMRHHKIVHCDLKPEVRTTCRIILSDDLLPYGFRTFCYDIPPKVQSRSLTLALLAMNGKRSTPTSSPDSTGPPKSFSEFRIPRPSTCGPWVALLSNCSSVCHCSRERASITRSRA